MKDQASDYGDTGQQQAKRLPVHLDPSQGQRTQFKKGQSGNPAGRPKGKSLSSTIQQMLDDEKFIERLSQGVRNRVLEADPDFQGTPMKAMITAALLEAINVNGNPSSKQAAREWLAKYGYGTKVDVTSKGERLSETPKVISVIAARDGDATRAETEAS